MIAYLDTSTLVKLYVDEDGSADARFLLAAADVIATSRVAYVEAVAAFARRLASARPTAAYRQAKQDLDRDWPDYVVIEVTEEIALIAAAMAEKHRLRGFDCLHLASALSIKHRLPGRVVFSSADIKLNAAAAKEGLPQQS